MRHRWHALAAREASDYSFAGEWEYLSLLRDRLGLTAGYVVDIAASDGVTQSCTLPLFRDPKWQGLAVEADRDKFALLAYAYREFAGTRLASALVTPPTVGALLRAFEVPARFEILNLDIDSYDLDVVDALLREYQPALISMEVNEKVPPPLDFTIPYRADHVYQGDHFYGCSIVAAHRVLTGYGYVLTGMHYNNAFFVRGDLGPRVPALTAVEAYQTGYLDKPDRLSLFPWNADLEEVLQMPPEEARAVIATRFQKYAGRFTLHD